MKKAKFLLGLVLIFVASTLFTACNVGDDSPPEYQLYAIYNEDFPSSSFELIDGTKYPITPITDLKDGSLLMIHFSIDENKVFKLINRSNAITVPGVMNSRLDTLGNGDFTTIRQIVPFKKYLGIDFRLNAGAKNKIHLACDSAKLGSNYSPYIKNDTMFLEIRYNNYGNPGYTDATDVHFFNLGGLPYQQDSVTIAVRYKTSEGSKSIYTKYKTPRY